MLTRAGNQRGRALPREWLAILGFSTAALGCQPRQLCMQWIRVHETYTVMLLKNARTTPSCAAMVDELAEGVRLPVKAVAREPLPPHFECDLMLSSIDVPGIEVPSVVKPTHVSSIYFGETFDMTVQGCDGTYSIGLAGVWGPERIAGRAVSDITLHRDFEPAPSTNCDASAIAGPGNRFCGDDWYVRVVDSTGRQISMDLTAASKDAGR